MYNEESNVVNCSKNPIFAYAITTIIKPSPISNSCELLKKSYLCLCNNNDQFASSIDPAVVNCSKNPIFAYAITTKLVHTFKALGCELLKKSYLCLCNNNAEMSASFHKQVVNCSKNPIFAYAITTNSYSS